MTLKKSNAVIAGFAVVAMTPLFVYAQEAKPSAFDRCMNVSAPATIGDIGKIPACVTLVASTQQVGLGTGCRIVMLLCDGVQHYAQRCGGQFYFANAKVPYPLARCTGWADHVLNIPKECPNDTDGTCKGKIRPLP